MREKKRIDCPICGSKKSMRVRRGVSEKCPILGYPAIVIRGLDGQFCSRCGDGFWSRSSERALAGKLAEHMARHDATRVVASELASVQEAAKVLRITVQGVHKMMDGGRLRYVFVAGLRLPIRRELAEAAKVQKLIRKSA